MTEKRIFTLPFAEFDIGDINKVGGKNASLGEMIQKLTARGIRVPNGFATTVDAYWHYLEENGIKGELEEAMDQLDLDQFTNLAEVSRSAQALILKGRIPDDVGKAIGAAYRELCKDTVENVSVAVRSSATAEDLPQASFAGQQETYLNISGVPALLEATKKCFASLFTARAIKYRIDHGFGHMDVGLSVGVQQMVRSDSGCSGVAFTLDPDTGFEDVVVINGIWGLGENLVKGMVDPDEFIVFKPTLRQGKNAILSRKLGKKDQMLVYSESPDANSAGTTVNLETPAVKQDQLVLTDQQITHLARWSLMIEEHYGKPMDIEWARDGVSGELFILQARPETVHTIDRDAHVLHTYKLKEKGKVLTTGIAIGSKIAVGKVKVLKHPGESDKLQPGDVLVTEVTNPDWDPIMKKASAVVTNKGGRTSHAAIVARELGVVAVIGTGDATTVLSDGQEVTVSCAEGRSGHIYDGKLSWDTQEIDTKKISLPKTEVMLILGDPERAFQHAALPNHGIGLMRLEFVISNAIKIHPMALVHYNDLEDDQARQTIGELTRQYENKEAYFVDQLAQAVATTAAPFYPKDVIVRMSDFKSNEYANLIGGRAFEPDEENPMLGFRGASRYYHPRYKEGFRLECEAMKKVRDEMGLTNVKLMIPFCRTVEEGKKVIELMAEYGLKQGHNGLEIYTMIEIPSNVILAEEFAEVFDGFSIGSNDLTQLTLGLDRDSELVQPLFNENNPAVKSLISQVIATAKSTGTKIGLCGQAPSDFPEYASFLVECGIDSISFTPDAVIAGIENINKAESQRKGR
jgi:pyruvate,water dikinase